MSIEWMDDFQIYGTGATGRTNAGDGAYAEVANVNGGPIADPDPSAPAASRAWQSATSDTTNFRKVLASGETTVGVAMRLWPAGLPVSEGNAGRPIAFANGANTVLCYLLMMTTGGLKVINQSGTVIGQTAGPVIVSGAWQHVEMKVLFDNAVGTIEVRVEGVEVINEVAVNTVGASTGPCEQVRCDNSSGSTLTYYVKDYIVWNGSGTANTDFLGSCAVADLTTLTDVSLNWTPSTGTTGWDLIDETPPNDDTDYISAADPPPAAAVFSLSDLDPDVTSVKGLMTIVRARKTDGGDGNLQVALISGASTASGADRAITAAYTYWSDVFETDPATAAAWSVSAVNAVNLSLDRTM